MVEPVLQIHQLYLNYGKQAILQDVSFQMYPGKILALIGPNGAGKSSTMRILAGLVHPNKGSGQMLGKAISQFCDLCQHTGFFIETPDFYNYLTARQNLQLLSKIRSPKIPIDELLKWVGLDKTYKKKVGQFSKGMKQRLGIAQALISDPEILILDEPFHGLDPEVKLFLMKLIIRLARENQKAILISSHLLSDLEELADDFILLNNGKVHLAGNIADYKKDKQVVRFYFEKLPPDDVLFKSGISFKQEDDCLVATLSEKETSNAVRYFSSVEYPPYKVIPENLLHAKYMEIAQ